MSRKFFVLDTAPGIALRAMLTASKKIVGTHLTINTFNLPHDDRVFLQKNFSNINAIKIDPKASPEWMEYIRNMRGCSIITMRQNVPFTSEMIQQLVAQPEPLRIIGQAGSTVSHIDVDAAKKQHVDVVYTPGANANAVAEFALSQLLYLMKNLATYHRYSEEKIWSKHLLSPRNELHEKVLGIIGFGYIGKMLCMKAQALGMRVIAYTRTKNNPDSTRELTFTNNLETLLANADVISVHVPLNTETKNMISEREIALMKQGSFIINTARGCIVDEYAVAAELKKTDSKLAGVAFDVFEKEGAQFESPLIGCPNTLLTPHVAGTTDAALSNAAVSLMEDIEKLIKASNKTHNNQSEKLQIDRSP